MKVLLDGWLQTLEEHQHQLALAYFLMAALSWKHWVKVRTSVMSAVLIYMASTLAVFAVSAYILTIVVYLLYPNYFDHIQPTVASISWLWMQGHELYPNWVTSDVEISVFGPLIFLINGMALLLNLSIFSSKLPGVLSLGAALAAISILVKRTTGSGVASLLLLGSLVILFGTFGAYVYWNRPEPFLILVSVLALLIISSRPSSLVTGVGIGVLAGVAAGLKLHGFIYLLPAAAIALARVETLSARLVMAIIGSACAVASALISYLERDVSIVGYLRFLRVALDERWSAPIFIENILFVFVLTAPIIVIWIGHKQTLNTPDRWLFSALGVSAATVIVIGAKAGAGSYYLLPLVPIFIYGIAVVGPTSKTGAKEIAALLFVVFFLAYGPHLLLEVRRMKYLYQVAASSECEKIAELKTYLGSYPDAEIGVSDDKHYLSYYYRVLSVWNGHPQHVDFAVWIHLASVGVDEEYIMRFIKECAVPTWILPLGTPFAKVNGLTDLPIASEGFRQTFATNYQQIETGQAYQVWKCKL